MGILPALESRPRLVLPDTPPELVSPGASSYSSGSSLSAEQQTWIPTAPISPMSSYEKPATADMSSAEQRTDGGHSRPSSATQAAPRQQLPSLSSLFGPPTTARPLHSPASDRPGPYSATSPLERTRLPSGDRHPPTSYFPQTLSPVSSQHRRDYESERPPLHALSRSLSGQGSPRFREGEHRQLDSRAEPEAGRWHHQQYDAWRHHEYPNGPRDSSFRSPQEQFSAHYPTDQERSAPSYPEQRPAQGAAAQSSPPMGTAMPESMSSKDVLGPKIWTGTHFLPRFVRAAEVPGEGLCYFYDDGSHCKTVIDGEAVTAHWGVTKAGKPRKRLAIACVTCREKKIKCDPDYPRCVQCEKFGRVCKFKNAPRGGHNTSPSTPPAELDETRKLGGLHRPNEAGLAESENSSPVSPRANTNLEAPEAGHQKRLRVGYDGYVPTGEPSITSSPVELPRSQLSAHRQAPELPRISDEVLSRAWRTDPSTSDPQSIRTVLSQFFAHLDATVIMRFIPESSYKAWVTDPGQRKSPEDLMLLYSVLAVGVALSTGPRHIAFEYAQVAHYAQRMSTGSCIQLAQSRILLALYFFSIARISDANEMLSAAAATSSCLQLNLEIEESVEAGLSVYPCGMSRSWYCEARRRTFWSLFLLERLNGHYPENTAMVNAEDVFIRLPADTSSFERQAESASPVFNPYTSNLSSGSERDLGVMAYLVEMVHIWSSDVARIYRMARRTTLIETNSEPSRQMLMRIQEWYQALPSRLTFTPANLESAAMAGELGSLVMMHLLYSHAIIKLNRHSLSADRSSSQVTSIQVQGCLEHATKVVNVAKTVINLHRGSQNLATAPPPVMATVFREAVDVLTATGRLSHLGDIVEDVRAVESLLDATVNTWDDGSTSRDAIDARLRLLLRIRERGTQSTSPVEGYRIVFGTEGHDDDKGFRWQITHAMETLYPREMDNIYATLP